jgi:hypothetical protein
MGALYITVHAIIWLILLRALYLILKPLSDPPSPQLDLPPGRLQSLAEELSSSADEGSRCASLLSILKQQMEKIDENLEIRRKLTQNIVNENQNILVERQQILVERQHILVERQQILVESQRIKRAVERLVATLKSRPSRVGKATADVKLPLYRPGTAAEDDVTASHRPRKKSF